MASPAATVTAVIQGQLLSWLVWAPSKPISEFSHRCPVGGIWHYPQHDYNSPFVDDELLFDKFMEELAAEEDDDSFVGQTHESKNKLVENSENVHSQSRKNHFVLHRQGRQLEDEIDPKDEKQHSTLIIQPRASDAGENKWTYAINLFLPGSTYYGLYYSSSDATTSIALHLHKAKTKDDAPEFADTFGLISCVSVDGHNRLFVVILQRKNKDAFPKFLQFFRVVKDVDVMPNTIEQQLAAAVQLVNNTKSSAGGDIDVILKKDLSKLGNKVQKGKIAMDASKLSAGSATSASQSPKHQQVSAGKSILERSDAKEKKITPNSRYNLHQKNPAPKIGDKKVKVNKLTLDTVKKESKTNNFKSPSPKRQTNTFSKDVEDQSSNEVFQTPTLNYTVNQIQIDVQCCNGTDSSSSKAHTTAHEYLESPEINEKPIVKVYQSSSQPNTTITKIKEKPLADGTTKKKTIEDIKLPDGTKTKIKTVIHTPDGEEKIRKKTLVITPNKNATKTDEVKVGKNSKSEKMKLTEVQITPTGSKQKNVTQKIKESPGKKKFTLEEKKQFVGPNKKKFENLMEKDVSSQKESENESEQKQESVQQSSSYSESTDGADFDQYKKTTPNELKIQEKSASEYFQNKPVNVSGEQIRKKENHHRAKAIHQHVGTDANSMDKPTETLQIPTTETQEVETKTTLESSSEITSREILTDTLPPSTYERPNFMSNFTEKVGRPFRHFYRSLLHPLRKKANATDFIKNPSALQNVNFETHNTTRKQEPSSGTIRKVDESDRRQGVGHDTSAKRRYLEQFEPCDDAGTHSKGCRDKRRRRLGSNL